MTKTINGDLILTKNTTFDESIIVKGSIRGYFDLKVKGNINALNIDALNINAQDINAQDINALNIDALNIDALNIDALNINAQDIDAQDIDALNINALNINAQDINAQDIICEKRIKKDKTNKTFCRIFIENKSKLVRKEKGSLAEVRKGDEV